MKLLKSKMQSFQYNGEIINTKKTIPLIWDFLYFVINLNPAERTTHFVQLTLAKTTHVWYMMYTSALLS